MRRRILFLENDMPNKKKPSTIRINEVLEPLLKKYTERFGSQSRAVTTVFSCYDTMMRMERQVLQELFNQQEINLMLNNALSTAYSPETIPGAVMGDTQDEINETFNFFEVDRLVILEKLRGLTLSQQFALVDWLIELKGNEAKEND
jgi:hypothetical protein